ncbi:MAG: hypothetical protein GY913_12680 [Proteobacteria bacterium]|nr:hypothetical protein [Pseudomonadota bacterium]MCP4917761.1 hypothetical protein [Pseudomonadota bacterium]
MNRSWIAPLLGLMMVVLPACEQTTEKSALSQPKSEIEKICGRSYTGIQGARDKMMQALTAEQQAQVPALFPKADFIETCKGLDEATAKCLDPNWANVAADECGPLIEALPEETKKAFQSLGEEKTDEAAEGEEGAEATPPEGGSAGDKVQEALGGG